MSEKLQINQIEDPEQAMYMAETEKPERNKAIGSRKVAKRIGQLLINNPVDKYGIDLAPVLREAHDKGEINGRILGHIVTPLDISPIDVVSELGSSYYSRRHVKSEQKHYSKDAARFDKKASKKGEKAGKEYDEISSAA
jgi:hypothetical protein